jgi:cobalt-zinc-cadmium efflux system protein
MEPVSGSAMFGEASYHCIHRPARAESRKALRWALGLTLAFVAIEAVGGFVARSLALLADAAHMLTDAAALGLSLFAAWIATRPAGAGKTYGYYRYEILAALANGGLLLAVTGGIVLEAVERLQHPAAVRADVLLGVAGLGLVANVVALTVLHRARGESLNVRGAYLHVLSDLAGSVGAILAGAVIWATGWNVADPLISIVLAALLLVGAWRLVRSSVDVLLEAAPRHVDLPRLEQAIAAVPEVRGVHDLHVWTVSSGIVAMSGHATVPDPARHQEVLEEIVRRVRGFGIQHVTVQLEQSPDCC